MAKIVHPKIKTALMTKDGKGALTVDQAKTLIGWQAETDSNAPKKGFELEYKFKDVDGNKVRLLKSPTNRPFRLGLAKRYANEMLRDKWRFNGETMVIDRHDFVQSAQHRLVALVLAEQMRLKDPEAWEATAPGPMTIEALLVFGISEKRDTVDTLDIGTKRTLGDIIFRNKEFDKSVNEKDQGRLANILSGATRLTWLRSGGKMVSDAPMFPHSEALDFIENHPRLVDATVFVFNEDGGSGAEGKRISGFLSLAYAAGLLYLMGTSATDPDKFADKGPEALDFSLWKKAEEFWLKFASGANLDAGDPILSLRNTLPRLDAGGVAGRDEIVGTVVKAFNLWVDGGKAKTAKDVKVKKTRNDDGKVILGEEPRLGGLDVVIEITEPDVVTDDGEDKPVKGSKTKGGWTAGDTAWVKEDDGDHWFGTVEDIRTEGNVKVADMVAEDGNVFEVSPNQLVVNRPK